MTNASTNLFIHDDTTVDCDELVSRCVAVNVRDTMQRSVVTVFVDTVEQARALALAFTTAAAMLRERSEREHAELFLGARQTVGFDL